MLRTSPARLRCELFGFVFLNLAIATLTDPRISKSAMREHASSVAFAHACPQKQADAARHFELYICLALLIRDSTTKFEAIYPYLLPDFASAEPA